WLQCGGQQTLESYGGTLEQIPPGHIDFFQRCQRYHETEQHLFFHANFDPALPAAEQDDQQLFWEHLRGPGPGQHISGKRVFVGHTPQDRGRILRLDHIVCLDTYCFGNGCLSAMEVHSETTWQANQQGITCLWPPQP
ncbi:MAG: serine/threonine protein phosphatase, partial [Planctomycetaceae bacterium]|nr:serine/threonine protein phosphatase [Planctomycetaceae bacterium]